MTTDRLLSVAEAAKRCPAYSEVSIRRMARAGTLPAVRHGRRIFLTEAGLREALGPLFR